MSYDSEKLLKLASQFEILVEEDNSSGIIVNAKKEKKLDPKAKVRNRGEVCVPAERAKDKKDHFPINNAAQARNALARVNQFTKAPDWYKGSLQSLINTVVRKVKSKYPSIEVTKESSKPGAKKKASSIDDIVKLAEEYVAESKSELQDQLINIRKQLSKLNLAKEFETEPSQLKIIRRKIEDLKSDMLGIKLQLESIQRQEQEEELFEESSTSTSMDSPYDYYAGGAADDGEV